MNMKRMRGRNHRPNGGGGGNNGGGFRNQQNGIPLNRNHVFDSSGPEMRIRGTAQQLHEKYQQLARDASSNGDRVTGEAYYQHAEHYFRIVSAINQAQGNPVQGQLNGPQQNGQQAFYSNNSQGGGQQGQERYGNSGRPAEAEAPNGQQNGQINHQPRRAEGRAFEPNNGERQYDPQSRDGAFSPNETRPAGPEARPFEPRRHEPRDDRNNDRQERSRPEIPVIDSRIDISSALEAELAAAVAEPAVIRQQVLEARAIPITANAPPLALVGEPLEPPARAALAPKPRGRPRVVKALPKE